jgi:hypothetical protein
MDAMVRCRLDVILGDASETLTVRAGALIGQEKKDPCTVGCVLSNSEVWERERRK